MPRKILLTALLCLVFPAAAWPEPTPGSAESMKRLLERLGSDDLSTRDGAEVALLSGWHAWDGAAMKLLGDARTAPDAEVAGRVEGFLARLELRREADRVWEARLGGLEAVIDRAEVENRVAIARAAIRTWSRGGATDADLRLLCALAVNEGWPLFPEIFDDILSCRAAPFGGILVAGVSSIDAGDQERALQALAILRPPECLEPVARLLSGCSDRSEARAALVAMRIQDHPDLLNRLLESSDPVVLQDALILVEATGAKSALASVESLVAGPDPRTRIYALRALRVLAPGRLASLAPPVLADPETAVGAGLFVRGGVTPELLLSIRPLLSSQDANVGFGAAAALMWGGADAACLPALEKLAGDVTDAAVAISAISYSGAPDRMGTLRRILASQDPDIAGLAARELGRLRSREDRPALRRMLDGEPPNERYAAASALGAIGDSSDLPVLAALCRLGSQLKDDSAIESALLALGLIGGGESVEVLEATMKGAWGRENVLHGSIQGLAWALDSRESARLWEHVKKHSTQRRDGWLALGRMGAGPWIPALQKDLRDLPPADRAAAGLAQFPWAPEGKEWDSSAEALRALETGLERWPRLAAAIALAGADRKTPAECFEILRDVRGQWNEIPYLPQLATPLSEALARRFEPEAWAVYITEREVKEEIATPEAFARWLETAGLTLDAGLSVWPGRLAAGRRLSPRAALARFEEVPLLSKGRVEIRRGDEVLAEWERRLREK